MGLVQFDAVFSGGNGDLYISNDETSTVMHFDQNGPTPQQLNLHLGHHILGVDGAVANGPGGAMTLTITGNIPAAITQNFPAGAIPPHTVVIYVTV